MYSRHFYEVVRRQAIRLQTRFASAAGRKEAVTSARGLVSPQYRSEGAYLLRDSSERTMTRWQGHRHGMGLACGPSTVFHRIRIPLRFRRSKPRGGWTDLDSDDPGGFERRRGGARSTVRNTLGGGARSDAIKAVVVGRLTRPDTFRRARTVASGKIGEVDGPGFADVWHPQQGTSAGTVPLRMSPTRPPRQAGGLPERAIFAAGEARDKRDLRACRDKSRRGREHVAETLSHRLPPSALVCCGEQRRTTLRGNFGPCRSAAGGAG
ncbi:hypothetical protein OBBRIDRAFT_392810 [Obba rivulosa]|uniref:Uncharacterized protein n=1 Tax=Obba rivulosa TaxID=1052685 RepID=A0A8E2AXH4_9APHY|nr:hypothetical protein OBBRIDRAFT_392810 [Obba rivulosa]